MDNDTMNEEEISELIQNQETEEMLTEAFDSEDIELISNARLRLEQGRLYEMLLKHDFFEGMDADQRAVSNVQREVRNFVRERLEVLVGLRPDPRVHKEASVQVQLPFNSLEIELLKKMLAKASNGATLNVEEPKQTVPAKLNPIKVTPLAAPKKVTAQKQIQKAQPRPQENKALPATEAEPLTKSPYQMSAEELRKTAEARGLKMKYKKAENPNKIPPPDADQMITAYTARQANIVENGIGTILNKMYGNGGVKMVEDVSSTIESTGDDRI